MPSERKGNRVLQYLVVFVVAVTINFLLPRAMPGDPLELLAGVDVGLLSPEERDEVLSAYGLDQPLWKQYLNYWNDLLHGDFGYSYRLKLPIVDLILKRLPYTLMITGTSLVISAILGVVMGAVSAWNHARKIDLCFLSSNIFLSSLPSFWLGMMLISIVSVRLGFLPSFGAVTPAEQYEGWEKIEDIVRHLVLPVTALSVRSLPGVYIVMRYTMLGVMGEDFIRTARAKGLREPAVLFKHVVRNSLAPVVTILALRLGYAFGGTVIIETVFSYPGIGRLIYEGVNGRDYPVLQAGFLVITIAILLSNLLADLIYPLLDPRARP